MNGRSSHLGRAALLVRLDLMNDEIGFSNIPRPGPVEPADRDLAFTARRGPDQGHHRRQAMPGRQVDRRAMARPRTAGYPIVTPAILLLCAGTILGACNTVAGVGRDLKSAGDAIEDAAN